MRHYGCCNDNTFSAGKYTLKVPNRNIRNLFELVFPAEFDRRSLWYLIGCLLPITVNVCKTHLDAVRGLILLRGFHPAHQQVELVGAMRLRSTRTNRSAYSLCQGLGSKLKNLD